MTNAMTKLATIAMRARLTYRALHSFPRAPTSSPQDQLSMRSATTIRKSRATSVGASSAAPARRAVAKLTFLVARCMTDLTGGPRRAPQQAAVDDQPGTDSRRGLDVGEVRAVTTRAPGQLRERSEVGIVLDLHRDPEPALHLRCDAKTDPARKDGRGAGGAVLAVDRSRDADPGADQAAPVEPRLGQGLRRKPG